MRLLNIFQEGAKPRPLGRNLALEPDGEATEGEKHSPSGGSAWKVNSDSDSQTPAGRESKLNHGVVRRMWLCQKQAPTTLLFFSTGN